MKKKIRFILLFIVLLIILFLLVFLTNKSNDDLPITSTTTTTSKIKKDMKVVLENTKCNKKEVLIHKFDDSQKIYSRCGKVSVIIDNNKYTLTDALNKKLVSIEDFKDNMEYILGVYDGGTTVYQTNNGDFSNGSFKLEICNKFTDDVNKRDNRILFLSINSDNYFCA